MCVCVCVLQADAKVEKCTEQLNVVQSRLQDEIMVRVRVRVSAIIGKWRAGVRVRVRVSAIIGKWRAGGVVKRGLPASARMIIHAAVALRTWYLSDFRCDMSGGVWFVD